MTATDTAAETPGASTPRTDTTARLQLVVACVFLAVGAVAYAGAAAKTVWPEFLDATATSYGRLLPAATNALLFGWLTLALLGAAYFIVPRLAETAPAFPLLALGSLGLIAGGVGAGIAAVVVGDGNAGGRYLELPLWADGIVAAGILAAAAVLTVTARRTARREVPLPMWYLVAASWWLALAWLIGAVPDSSGLPAAIQGWFAVTAITGLWMAAAGIGVGYYLVARFVPGVEFHPRLGRIGFWSLALCWAWTAGRAFQYGPTPDWMETLAVLFSAGLVVAALTVAADFVLALRGRWDAVRTSLPLRFFVVGTALFLVLTLQMFVSSLRTVGSVVHLTAWETALEELLLFGPFTFWALAFVYHVFPAGGSRPFGRRVGALHLWMGLGGLLTALFSRWLAGLQQGYTWLAAAQSGEFENYGNGFRNTVNPVEGLQTVQFVGLAVFAVALVPFLAGVVRRAVVRRASGGEQGSADLASAPLGRVLRGAVALFVLSVLAVAVAPASESDEGPSLLASASRRYPAHSPEARGAELYVVEGCWYCHTQQVRPIVTDVRLGPVSTPGDYFYDEADVLGIERIGPDLTHAGSRSPTDSVRWNLEHLRDPRGGSRPWSPMPAYGHLGEDDLIALASYIAGLE